MLYSCIVAECIDIYSAPIGGDSQMTHKAKQMTCLQGASGRERRMMNKETMRLRGTHDPPGVGLSEAQTRGYPGRYAIFLTEKCRGSSSSNLGSGHDTLHTLNQHRPNQALAHAVQVQVGFSLAPLKTEACPVRAGKLQQDAGGQKAGIAERIGER